MRVLHVISSLAERAGGPPIVATRLAAAQAGLGHDVTILCYDAGEQQEVRHEFPIPDAGRPLKVVRIDAAGTRERILAPAAGTTAHKLLDDHDILHVHGIWEPMLRAAASAADELSRPYVIAPHGMLDTWALAVKTWKKKLALAIVYRRFIRGASLLHALSQHEQECVADFGYRGPVELIPNGVFMDEIEPLPAPGATRARIPELGDDPFILFLSRLAPVKRLDLLAEAFSRILDRHPAARLVVAGPDWGAEQPLREQIKQLGIQNRVHLTGPLYGADKFAAMVDAACFCLPSRHEAFSVAVVEALAVGCPVVITENCNFPEVASAGAGAVVPLDAASVADALDQMLTDAEWRSAAAKNARQLVLDHYTWPKIAEKSITAYQRVLA